MDKIKDKSEENLKLGYEEGKIDRNI